MDLVSIKNLESAILILNQNSKRMVKGMDLAQQEEQKRNSGVELTTTPQGQASPPHLCHRSPFSLLQEAGTALWQVQTHSPWHGICHQMAPL